MVILTQPASFSLSGNLEKFQIRADETISFILMKGTEEILSASYTPGSDQAIVIDLREIVESHLSFRFIDQQTSYVQESLVADFTAIIDGTEYPFRVLRGGVDRLGTSAENFCRANFLTWQPQIKPVTYYTPEFLGYYCLEDATVYVKAYFTAEDGTVTSEVKAIATLFHGYAYTIPVQYAVICSAFDSRFPSFYDVWVQDSAANRLTYVQRYVADNILSEQEEWILFENSLGGIDTFRAYGQANFKGKHTHNVAEIDDVSLEYRVDTERTFQKSTGFLNNYQRRWLLDFFPSKVKYVYVDNYIRSIVVTEDNTTYTDKELPTEYKFTYRYADARPYLNLSRSETLPSNLDIVLPELGSFTIPPRLVEFPTQPLSGGVLFPVQNPFSEKWGTVTVGAIVNYILGAVSSGYDGHGGFGHAHANYELLNLLSYVEGYLLVDGKKIKAGYADDISSESEVYKKFLRKDQPDTAQEIITFLKGLLVGQNGHGISVLEDGSTQAVVDRLYVNVKAFFDALEVKKKTYVGGEQILTPSGMKCVRVEQLATAYRCYFRAEEDGVAIENAFTVGQLAICQECNVRIGVSNHVGNRFYWREVVGVGDDYIDLSMDVCASDSVAPAAGDDIVGLGHRSDVVRQSAIVLSSVGSTAPSIIFYQGIDDFSLSGKEVMALEYDRSTGHAKVRIYGSTYIGDKNGDSYLAYSPESGVEVKAKKIILGSGESLDKTIGDISQNVSHVATQLDGSIEIWQGDYASTDERLLADKVTPSKDWDTDSELNGHLGDYLVLTNGACYEFQYDEENQRYVWLNVTDQYLIAYLRTLDTKKAIFKITDDTLPLTFFGPKAYHVGDLWVNAVYPESGEKYNDETLVCITPKAEGEQFDITHWVPADGTKKKLLEAGIDIDTREIAFTAEQFKFKNLLGDLFAVLEEVDGVPTIRTELLNITGQLIAEKIMASGLDIGGKFIVAVDEDGKVSVKLSGMMESSASGRRIVINPDTQRLEMYMSDGKLAGMMYFIEDGGWEFGGVELYRYNGDNLHYKTICAPGYLKIINYLTNEDTEIFPEYLKITSREMEKVKVGFRYVYDGMTYSRSVVDIYSSAWPSVNDAGPGSVYLDGNTLKVKT